MHCHALEDSRYPKGLQAAWVKGTCAQEVEQKAAPSKVEGVREKGRNRRRRRNGEEEEWGCQCDGPEVGSSLEVGWGWFHLAGEVGQVE